MSTSKSALSFDSSLPRAYSDSWRKAYGQSEDTRRLSSYQAPNGKPVVFAYDSINLDGGQNMDTSEYPYGYWSNTQLGEKAQSVKIKGHLIGENYIASRNKIVTALQTATDDDNPGTLDLPLWGRFKVVVITWSVAEEKSKTGLSDISLEFKRAGYSDARRFDEASKNLAAQNIDGAVSDLKTASAAAFAAAVEKQKDVTTLSQGFGKLTSKLQAIVGRVQGARTVLNGMTNKINSITNLIAQGIRAPAELAQAFVSAAFGIVEGIMEIKNAADETASYFMRDDDDDSESTNSGNSSSTSSTLSPTQQETVMQDFIATNEKNVLMQFLSSASYKLDETLITEAQYNTVAALENLYKACSFGVCAQLITKLDADTETYGRASGLWKQLEKLEDSIDKEDSAVFAAIEKCRIACAQMLLSYSYDVELKRNIRREMPLLALAVYLGCDEDRLRSLNAVSDSFLMIGEIIYV